MRQIILQFFIIIAINQGVWAQVGPGQAIERQFRDLEQQIIVGRDLLRLFPNPQAEEFLRKAEQLRNELLTADRRNPALLTNLLLALNFSNRAINLLSQFPVERLRQQVEDLIRRAEQIVPTSNNKEAERLLREAQKSHQSAANAIAAGNYRMAMEQFRLAKFYSERGLGMVEGSRGTLQDLIQAEQERFEELFQRADEAVRNCNNQNATKLFLQAKKQHQGLRQGLLTDNPKLTLNQYNSTTRLLLRVIDICQGYAVSDREQAAEEFELLTELLETAVEQTGAQNPQRGKLVIDRAKRLQQQAAGSMNENNYPLALRQLTLARNLLSRAWSVDTDSDLQEKTTEELAALRNEFQHIQQQYSRSEDARARSLLRAVESSLQDAERFLATGRIRLALTSILSGQRFLNQLESRRPTDEELANRARMELERLKARYDQSRAKERLTPEEQELVEAAYQAFLRATQALEEGQYELCIEYIKLGFDLLDKVKQ